MILRYTTYESSADNEGHLELTTLAYALCIIPMALLQIAAQIEDAMIRSRYARQHARLLACPSHSPAIKVYSEIA